MAAPRGAAAKAAANRAARPQLAAVPDPEKKAPAKATPAKKATPAAPAPTAEQLKEAGFTVKQEAAAAPKSAEAKSLAQQRAETARKTHEEALALGGEQKCAGQCGETKPMTSFPTTGRRADGSMGRGKICRACRDAGRKAAKAEK